MCVEKEIKTSPNAVALFAPCIEKFDHFHKRAIDSVQGIEHVHDEFVEITIVIKGSGSYKVNKKNCIIVGNEILVTLPGIEHDSHGNGQFIGEYYYLKINLFRYPSILGLTQERTQEIVQRLLSIEQAMLVSSPRINELVALAYANFCTGDTLHMHYAQLQLAELLYLLCIHSVTAVSSSNMDFLSCAEQYIQDHIKEPIALDAFAESMGYSTSYFKTKFRKIFGMTPNNYIMRQKIQVAKNMLQNKISVTETAMELGFGSSNYFSTVFRNFTSMTPREFGKSIVDEEDPLSL